MRKRNAQINYIPLCILTVLLLLGLWLSGMNRAAKVEEKVPNGIIAVPTDVIEDARKDTLLVPTVREGNIGISVTCGPPPPCSDVVPERCTRSAPIPDLNGCINSCGQLSCGGN